MAEIVKLETRSADGGQDAGVGDGARGDGEFAGAEDEVAVGCCSRGALDTGLDIYICVRIGVPKRISDNEKGDVDFIGVFQDVVARRFDHFAVSNGDRTAIEGFLLSERHQLAMVYLLKRKVASSPTPPFLRVEQPCMLQGRRAPPSSQSLDP